ncbi:shikimate kinase [Pontibacter actiniarum]|uniref:Shikimate kinase n=1 Tax=Pontibacter actiniarum TaxID=323450 RepID=A0A1X9YVF4_9BACT|nr:shikimate kinase [Pontibacter actiniarum]ARS36801.1 shikimate kinase [Pontibacter actiniarum]
MLVFLVGMMGCGKTTLGRQLAQRLGYTFLDLDEHIVRQQGQPISQIFAQQGQERFRELEREALQEVVQLHQEAVIATGGGAPCFFDNMAFINRHGASFFIDVPVDELARRLIAQGQEERPLLAGKRADELKSYLAETLTHRRQFYERASHTLPGATVGVDAVLRLLNL